jgi:dolichyl-phosphate-mannose--protein O-mannosyl transferase
MASYTQYFMIKGGKSLADWWDAQKYMYSYHSTLQATHFFESPWYEWPIMLRPMWFQQGQHDGLISTINTMGTLLCGGRGWQR